MAQKIIPGANIRADHFIELSERDATPANDEGRVVKLETDGKFSPFYTKNGAVPNAGATINGSTLPVPVYQNKTDNEMYACDGNDPTALKFQGFAISNGTNANPITVQYSGVVGGFSGLDEGEKYYLSDTAGTISTTPGTYEVLVGIAISPTELLIQKGTRRLTGTATFSSTTTSTVTLGFRPSSIRIHAVRGSAGSGQNMHSHGGWTNAGNLCIRSTVDNSGNGATDTSSHAWNTTRADGSQGGTGIVDTVTDTGFRLNHTNNSSTTTLFWEAEGYL